MGVLWAMQTQLYMFLVVGEMREPTNSGGEHTNSTQTLGNLLLCCNSANSATTQQLSNVDSCWSLDIWALWHLSGLQVNEQTLSWKWHLELTIQQHFPSVSAQSKQTLVMYSQESSKSGQHNLICHHIMDGAPRL